MMSDDLAGRIDKETVSEDVVEVLSDVVVTWHDETILSFKARFGSIETRDMYLRIDLDKVAIQNALKIITGIKNKVIKYIEVRHFEQPFSFKPPTEASVYAPMGISDSECSISIIGN